MDLSIIYVNFQSIDLIKESILSLQKYPADLDYEIIVVQNGTDTGKLALNTGKIKSVQNHTNRGFGAGCNLGAKEAKGDYLLFLNPDTLIVDASVAKLVSFLKEHSEVGAVTPLLYTKDRHTLQNHFFGDFLSLKNITLNRGARHCHCEESATWQSIPKIASQSLAMTSKSDFFYTPMVSGAAMMVKKTNFEKVGGFDENFFMYLEDDDLCRRLSNINLKNAVLSTAKIIHLEESENTDRVKRQMYYQSQNYYFKKYYGLSTTLLMRLLRLPYKFFRSR